VNGNDGWVVFEWVLDKLRVSQRCIWIKKVVGASGELDPFAVRSESGHVGCKRTKDILRCGRGTGLPLVEGLPCGLDRLDDAFFEMGRVLLHHDDGFLKEVFFQDLPRELTVDSLVGNVSDKIMSDIK